MADHGIRDHAEWSASATARNWACSGALALTKDMPEKTNEAADWGTCAHQIAERCLLDGVQAESFIGTTEKGKAFSFEVDEEMAETSQMFVDYVRKQSIKAAGKKHNPADLLQVEQNFSLSDLQPPFEAGGTADAVIYFPELQELEVVDLKGGRGVIVEVTGNPQLRTYALGAMLANSSRKVSKITVTIVQPRAPHKDGKIRSETFHTADLIEWTSDLLAAMERSNDALVAAAAIMSARPHQDAGWWSTYLNAGEHCKFCRAAGFCPALEQRSLDAAGVWFDDLDQPRISNTPDTLSPERAAQLLDAADMIGEWINAVRAYWHEQAESGVEIPNYALVPKQGREKWDEGTEAQVYKAVQKAGLDEAKYLNPPKLKTPKQVRKALGKQEDLVAGLSSTPDAGTNLVRTDKTTREAVPPKAHQHLDILD